ncbi:band 7 family protein [Stylonychia lemnae]|uniref:Band 7 family protein n=1 Tax=Stylonychia lemnae TaxID=5949 RepID=A0A078BA63_STYLE|nr:band 7 family protein [Stylonychia lemnae]|eukprot:CDW91395.1 band 7 family protein [Stylonychia lemnae]
MLTSKAIHLRSKGTSFIRVQQRGFDDFADLDRGFRKQFGGNTASYKFINLGFLLFIREKNSCLIHRFEKYNRRLDQGFNFKIPFIEKIAYCHDLREQVIEILPQTAVTRDNVALNIDGVLYIQIIDPIKVSYNVENIYTAITNLAQTVMRSEIGKISLDRTFEERQSLNEKIVNAVHRETADWGIKTMRYEIKDIVPPENIQNSMILQAEAERKKRAQILASEGDRVSNINRAEASKRAQVLEAEGKAESMIIQAEASSSALTSIDESLKSPSGMAAAQFLLGQRYIQCYQRLAKKDNLIVMNNGPIDVKEKIQDSLNFFREIKNETQL